MGRSITRVNDLNKVFRNGDSDLLNEVGVLCILFEDFKHEILSLLKYLPETGGAMAPDKQHEIFYYVRRSLITLDEVKEHLRAICANEEFRSAKDQIGNKNAALIIEAQRYLSRNSILKNLRNYMGAHIDSAVVRSSIKYFGPDAVSRIRWVDDKTDFALRFDFATDLLKGAIASKLPRGIEHLEEEMPGFFQVLTEAFKYLQHATFILVHAFLWDRFGTA
jgi:hypothetical protein